MNKENKMILDIIKYILIIIIGLFMFGTILFLSMKWFMWLGEVLGL